MMQLLPTEIRDWVNQKDFSIDNYSNDSPIGCFLKVDLDYPDELHDLHNGYPLAGETLKVAEEILSKYQLQIIEYNIFSLGKNKKLIPNPGNKRKCNSTIKFQNFTSI